MSWISYLYERTAGSSWARSPPIRPSCRRAATGKRSRSSTRRTISGSWRRAQIVQFLGAKGSGSSRSSRPEGRPCGCARGRSVRGDQCDRARHREPEGSSRPGRRRGRVPARGGARERLLAPQSLLRDGRGVRLRGGGRAAQTSTGRSSTPGSSCRSTTPSSCTSTTRFCRWAGRSRTTVGGPRCVSTRSTTRSRASPRIGSATTSAGEAGTARTRIDVPLTDIVDLVLRVEARSYSIEAANAAP